MAEDFKGKQEDNLQGLSSIQVKVRRQAGLDNRAVKAPSKSVWQIISSNLFTYFNLVFLVIAILLILVKSYRDLTFLPIIIANTLIGIIQEIRAKQVLDKLNLMNVSKVLTLRDGEKQEIAVADLVKDDIIELSAGNQIPADARVVGGEVMVNESLLTGEADEVKKKSDDLLLSGGFIVSGKCYARLEKVGKESYISELTLKAKMMRRGEQSEIIRSLNKIVKVAGVAIIPIFWGGAQCAGKCTRDGSRGDRDDSRRVVFAGERNFGDKCYEASREKGFIARYEINRNVGAGGYIMCG